MSDEGQHPPESNDVEIPDADRRPFAPTMDKESEEEEFYEEDAPRSTWASMIFFGIWLSSLIFVLTAGGIWLWRTAGMVQTLRGNLSRMQGDAAESAGVTELPDVPPESPYSAESISEARTLLRGIRENAKDILSRPPASVYGPRRVQEQPQEQAPNPAPRPRTPPPPTMPDPTRGPLPPGVDPAAQEILRDLLNRGGALDG